MGVARLGQALKCRLYSVRKRQGKEEHRQRQTAEGLGRERQHMGLESGSAVAM